METFNTDVIPLVPQADPIELLGNMSQVKILVSWIKPTRDEDKAQGLIGIKLRGVYSNDEMMKTAAEKFHDFEPIGLQFWYHLEDIPKFPAPGSPRPGPASPFWHPAGSRDVGYHTIFTHVSENTEPGERGASGIFGINEL